MPNVEPTAAPFGAWASLITTDRIVGETVGLNLPVLDGGDVYWLESRPAEAGRSVVVRRQASGAVDDVLAPPWNIRSRVHEYGGGAYAVRNGIVVFSHDGDGRLYRVDVVDPEAPPQPLTPEATDRALRYADLAFDPSRNRLLCVREDHRAGGEPANELVAVSLSPTAGGDEGAVLSGGSDFVSSPTVGADGRLLAFLTWDHPNMPWDGTDLWVARFAGDGSIAERRHVAGGRDVSVFQPQWLADGSLVFAADPTGWWNLYRLRDPFAGGAAEALLPVAAEFAVPQWVFGASTTAVLADGRLAAAANERGIWSLYLLDPDAGTAERMPLPFDTIQGVRAAGHAVVLVGGAPAMPPTVALLDVRTGDWLPLRHATEDVPDAAFLSVPRPIAFPTTGGATAHGLFYPPANPAFVGPAGERPPLLVLSHGGPTSAVSATLNLQIQFWTSRGIAVLDVNYGGSTGYGRAYRERLAGQWGIVDVDDCCNGARWLCELGEADPARTIIRGGSAGGYTTLAALAFRNRFAAGSCYYGISDLETMATDTHKFESRYLDKLVAPYPERRDVYLARSPIYHLDGFERPLILLQGLEDKVVPPDQSERMYEAVRAKGLPVAYVAFPGEQHGFRDARNIKRALEAELYFFGRVFGFDPADEIAPVPIANA